MRAAGTVAATTTALATALSVLIIAEPFPAFSGNDYPTRPVTLIVPYAAGGVADLGMRILADKLSSRLGQQFVVEDRPGAGGVVAAQAGASAAARRLYAADDRQQHRDRGRSVQLAAL